MRKEWVGSIWHMVKKHFNKLKNHRSKGIRITAGILLVVFGLLGFLPILGFWMIPLGIILLSVDFHWARRLRRKFEVWWGRRTRKRRAKALLPKPPKNR